MRTKNSMRNSIIRAIFYFVSLFFSFLSQTLFVKVLGIEYLGLKGLYTNILLFLGYFELGLSGTIILNLYKPIASKDFVKIKSLLSFYKRMYQLIMIIILIVGLLIMPFLSFLVGDINIDVNIYIIYLLSLISSLIAYKIDYEKCLFIANQHGYFVDILHIGYLVILNTLQIIILYITKNYYLYLEIKIICQLIEYIIINRYSIRNYPYLSYQEKPLDSLSKKKILSEIKPLFFYQANTVINDSIDTITISYLLGIKFVGLYSNYFLVINALNSFIIEGISAINASLGNLLVTENKTDNYVVFKRIRFLNFYLSAVINNGILNTMQLFIVIWLGKEYLLSNYLVVALVFYGFQLSMRTSYFVFINATGIWRCDIITPILEIVTNIVFSIYFTIKFGLMGVIIGSIISSLVLWFYTYPKFIYKGLFKRKYINYFKENFCYFGLFIVISIINYCIISLFMINNIYLKFIFNSGMSVIITSILIFLIFHKTDEFIYFEDLFKKMRFILRK